MAENPRKVEIFKLTVTLLKRIHRHHTMWNIRTILMRVLCVYTFYYGETSEAHTLLRSVLDLLMAN